MIVERKISSHIHKMLEKFPVVSLTGPRQSGKTTLLRADFPDYKYYNLERLDHRDMISTDPSGFLRSIGTHVIFDEAQNLPELFSYIQVISDERNTPGQYILSGSQSFLLSERISQSLAGRVSINQLLPFDLTELEAHRNQSPAQAIHIGSYPRIYDYDISPEDFYPSYLQTYIERDIRMLKAVANLSTFSRFMGLCAGRIGQVINLTSLANDAGIAVNTAKSWLSMLESSYIIYLLQPYYNNFNKRLIKSPKLYFVDTGVASSLLKLSTPEMVLTHYQYGALFENLIISEIVKCQYHSGKRPSVYYWRESNGNEIDCIIDKGADHLVVLEIKGGQTFTKDYLKVLKQFPDSDNFRKIKKMLLYAGDETNQISNIQVTNWKELPALMGQLI